MKTAGILACFLLLGAIAADAQRPGEVFGQILLPGGDTPRNPIPIRVTSSDGRYNNDVIWTDSNGRFTLSGVGASVNLTLTIEKNEAMGYDTTTKTVVQQYEPTPRIILNPLRGAKVTGMATISAASGHQPLPEAAALQKNALKDIEKQQFDQAEQRLRKAIALDPQFVEAHVHLAALLMQRRNFTQAESVLQKAYEVDPKSVLVLLNLGLTRNRLGKFAEAVPLLREALRLQPGLVAAHSNLGVALVETEKFEEAESELERGAKAGDADELIAQLYLGKLYAQTGKYEKAVAAFELYLQKAPNAPNANDVRELIKKLRQQMTPGG